MAPSRRMGSGLEWPSLLVVVVNGDGSEEEVVVEVVVVVEGEAESKGTP